MESDRRESEDSIPSPWDVVAYVSYLLTFPVGVQYSRSFQDQVPAIVTIVEIQKAADLCPHRVSGCKILEINESTILKVGHTVTMGEAEAMCLVRRLTSVPVPQVFNAYVIDQIGFILMEKIPGQTLAQQFDHLSDDSLRKIATQLGEYVQQWRNIEGAFLGSVDKGPCQDVIFKHSWENVPRHYGPYQTREEFNKGIIDAMCHSRPTGKLHDDDDQLANRILSSGTNGGDKQIVLTHGDLHVSNIILQGDEVVGIIDWGAAGFSIPEREYFCLRWSAELSWRKFLSYILPSSGYEFWAEVNYAMMAYTCI